MENTNKTELLFGFINLNERKQLIGVLISVILFFGFVIWSGMTVVSDMYQKVITSKDQEIERLQKKTEISDEQRDRIYFMFIEHLAQDKKVDDSLTISYRKLKKEIDHENKNR